MFELDAQLEHLVPVGDEVVLQREDLEETEDVGKVAPWPQVADAAFSERNTVEFLKVIDLGPHFVEAYELHHDLLALLEGVDVGL